jgi:hypothetical protein
MDRAVVKARVVQLNGHVRITRLGCSLPRRILRLLCARPESSRNRASNPPTLTRNSGPLPFFSTGSSAIFLPSRKGRISVPVKLPSFLVRFAIVAMIVFLSVLESAQCGLDSKPSNAARTMTVNTPLGAWEFCSEATARRPALCGSGKIPVDRRGQGIRLRPSRSHWAGSQTRSRPARSCFSRRRAWPRFPQRLNRAKKAWPTVKRDKLDSARRSLARQSAGRAALQALDEAPRTSPIRLFQSSGTGITQPSRRRTCCLASRCSGEDFEAHMWWCFPRSATH